MLAGPQWLVVRRGLTIKPLKCVILREGLAAHLNLGWDMASRSDKPRPRWVQTQGLRGSHIDFAWDQAGGPAPSSSSARPKVPGWRRQLGSEEPGEWCSLHKPRTPRAPLPSTQNLHPPCPPPPPTPANQDRGWSFLPKARRQRKMHFALFAMFILPFCQGYRRWG